jgi:hypothetical protein
MPSFPKPTHGPKLKPFVTAKETLEHMYIPRSSVADHQKPSGRTVVCDPNKPFPVTLVRKRHPVRKIGGENYKILHWDNRYFTVEELAQLQQFSNERTWEGSEAQIAGMIGDAVQPKPFSHIFMEVRKTLEDTDRGDGTISRSEFDKPVALRPKDLSPFSRARIGDSELPDIEQLFAKNVPVFKPAVSRKRLSLTQPLTLPQKKQRKCR